MCYLEVLPFFATFERGKSSGSLLGSNCRSYAGTSALAWAPISHIAYGGKKGGGGGLARLQVVLCVVEVNPIIKQLKMTVIISGACLHGGS